MQTFTTAGLREELKGSAEGSKADEVAAAADAIQFLEFSDIEKSVKDEVEFVKGHPLIVKETEVTGWVYHVESGKVSCVKLIAGLSVTGFRTGSSRGLTIEPGI